MKCIKACARLCKSSTSIGHPPPHPSLVSTRAIDPFECVYQLTLGEKPGMRRSASLHKTTPSFSDVFKNSSGSAMFFLGELSTPSDINHVTVCSSGFIVPKQKNKTKKLQIKITRLHAHRFKKNKINKRSIIHRPWFRVNTQQTSALTRSSKRRQQGGREDDAVRHVKLIITPTGKQAPQHIAGV